MKLPRSIASVMQSTLKEFNLESKAKNYEVVVGWADVVGERIASNAVAEKFERGILTIRVTDSVWKYELSMRKGELITKLNQRFKPTRISEIVIR